MKWFTAASDLRIVSFMRKGSIPLLFLSHRQPTWPTYNGDYSGRRYSTLNQINKTNVAGPWHGMGVSNSFDDPEIHASRGKWHFVLHNSG